MPTVKNVTQKEALLVNALNNYCGITVGCGTHSNDIDPLVIQVNNICICTVYVICYMFMICYI